MSSWARYCAILGPLTNMTPRQIIEDLPYSWGLQIITHQFQSSSVRMYRAGSQSRAIADEFARITGK